MAVDDVIGRLAELAKVPSEHRDLFHCKIDGIIRELSRFSTTKGKRTFSKKQQLEQISKAAKRLRQRLELVEFSVKEIIDCGLVETGKTSYQHCIENLEVLDRAIEWGKKVGRQPKGRPAGIRTSFDLLVWQLLSAARTYGGDLKIYKDTHSEGGWSGSLLEGVCLLKSILPRAFVPAGNLGNVLDRIAKPFRH